MAPLKKNPSYPPPVATSMKQIAERAGVHVSTVSLALRNSPKLASATRERIRKLANEMGYKPNPMVVALMQQRRRRTPSQFHGIIAFITHSPNSDILKTNEYIARIYRTASAHAEELGYKLDHFEVFDYGGDPKRLERALHARNIRGLFFPPPENSQGEIVALNWEHFVPVTMSTSIIHPPMDRIDGDHHASARLAFQQCIERGYRRPGFVTLASSDHRTQGRWRAGFLASQQETKQCQRIPVLMGTSTELEGTFESWYLRWRPDVIFANGLTLQICIPALESLGVQIPEECAIVMLNIHDWDDPRSGIYTAIEISSSRAIDHIVSRLHRNIYGLPNYPQTSIFPPIWKEGKTLPAKKPPSQP